MKTGGAAGKAATHPFDPEIVGIFREVLEDSRLRLPRPQRALDRVLLQCAQHTIPELYNWFFEVLDEFASEQQVTYQWGDLLTLKVLGAAARQCPPISTDAKATQLWLKLFKTEKYSATARQVLETYGINPDNRRLNGWQHSLAPNPASA